MICILDQCRAGVASFGELSYLKEDLNAIEEAVTVLYSGMNDGFLDYLPALVELHTCDG